jgi:signal transduction histidine kinase
MFSNFKLISELFDNLVIFTGDYSIIYQGYSIKTLLSQKKIDISQLKNSTLEVIKQLNGKKHVAFTIPDIKEEFVLFPYDNQPNSYAFGLKDKVMHIAIIEHDLKERVKELEGLYLISRDLDSSLDLKEVFEPILEHIRQAFQIPSDTLVSIQIGRNIYGCTDINGIDIYDTISCDIKLNEEIKGKINVYSQNKIGFLEEEHRYIGEVASKIASKIERTERENNLEKQQKILKAKNEILLRLGEECKQSREKLRAFFNAITSKIVVVDKDFNINMSNKEDIGDSGKCYNKLFGLDEPCKECPAIESIQTGSIAAKERIDDDKYFQLDAYPIFGDDGKVDSILEVCQDITMQKKMEEQLLQSYKLASLGKLVAGVAHEINNPNTFILGNLKIIQETFNDIFPLLDLYYQYHPDLKIARLDYKTFKENITILVEDMLNGANRTKKIVTDLRNFAKKDEGGLTEEIDLNYIITNNLTFTQKHTKKYARLEIDLGSDLPNFKGNLNKIEQLLLNLIINASEAIEHDEGLIKIVTRFNKETNDITLVVSDNGSGMPDNVKKNIFDPFFTTKRNKGGTGLGLSISYGIVKDHNGTIEVESKVGQGTKFTVRFPVKTNK